jgi:hypothetical protein
MNKRTLAEWLRRAVRYAPLTAPTRAPARGVRTRRFGDDSPARFVRNAAITAIRRFSFYARRCFRRAAA